MGSEGGRVSRSGENFVRQNGFAEADQATCAYQFPALMFQPRVIAAFVALGLWLQSWPVFAGLSLLLWWNVALPRLNPFDRLHDLLAAQRGHPPLPPAVGPRRFAQAIAACTTLGVAVSLWYGSRPLALLFEAGVVTALTLLLVGRLCLGSYLFHVIRGQSSFGNRTLPWAKAPKP
jgi:hypothetical protein